MCSRFSRRQQQHQRVWAAHRHPPTPTATTTSSDSPGKHLAPTHALLCSVSRFRSVWQLNDVARVDQIAAVGVGAATSVIAATAAASVASPSENFLDQVSKASHN